ncbi:MAG TPA: hypothetical protein VEI25_09175 [Paraburkholderia sp.]|nr:hypothetical protein [Paraburkholderia sp.]
MQKAALFHVVLDYLEANDTPSADVERFVDRWHRLRPQDPAPCPVCYLAGEEQPLIPLPPEERFLPVGCPTCRTRFDVPVDD